jgi:hypothetical protein
MSAAATAGSLLARLVRTAVGLAAEAAAKADADGPNLNVARRAIRAALQIANPRSPYAPAVFGAVLAIVLALVWAELDRRRDVSASQVFRLPGAEATAPLPLPKPLRYAPPR